MRKLVMCLSVLAGLFFAGTIPASANAAAGMTAMQVKTSPGIATDVRWRGRRWGHRGWRRGWGWGPNIYIGVPYYGYGYYPYYYGGGGYYGGYYGGGGYGYRRGWRYRGYGYGRGWRHRGYGYRRGGWGHRGYRGGWAHRGGGFRGGHRR
jgi:hypothetical protein